MFFLKFDQFFAQFKDAKDHAKTLDRLKRSEADPRELQKMRAELRAAQEHARLMNIINRNRIF